MQSITSDNTNYIFESAKVYIQAIQILLLDVSVKERSQRRALVKLPCPDVRWLALTYQMLLNCKVGEVTVATAGAGRANVLSAPT